MGTKTISIMDDVYDMLKKRKRAHESFSEVIRRGLKKRDIMSYAGIWKDVPDATIGKMKGAIKDMNQKGTKALHKRTRDLR